MNNLEEEKKLVAEKLGFYWNEVWGTICFLSTESPKNGLLIEYWNPQDDNKATCKEWNVIWEKMNLVQMLAYYLKLEELFKGVKSGTVEMVLKIHTAKPSICWEALIKTLREIYK